MIVRCISNRSLKLISFEGSKGSQRQVALSQSGFFPYTRVKNQTPDHLLKGPEPIATRTNHLLVYYYYYYIFFILYE